MKQYKKEDIEQLMFNSYLANEEKEQAYQERNILALMLALKWKDRGNGWFKDTGNNYEGFKRVISIDYGAICFHVPDDFDLGVLPEIEPNWNGHTTEEKLDYMRAICGMRTDVGKAQDEIRSVLKKYGFNESILKVMF